MSDRDDMQVRAETAPATRLARAPLSEVIQRAYKNDGHGLTPGEVMRLADAARRGLSGEPVE